MPLAPSPARPIVRAGFGIGPRKENRFGQGRREEGGAGLFGRPRHLDHPEVAADDLRLRGGHLHGRSRPGRGTRAGARQGDPARHQAGEHLYRGPARGIRARLRVPDVPRQCAL